MNIAENDLFTEMVSWFRSDQARDSSCYIQDSLNRSRLLFTLLFALLLAARMCHVNILWEGDTLPIAAAGQMLGGHTIYRDIWFDKPPLVPVFYLLCGARPGWPLRLEDAFYALLCCWVVYRFARDLWGNREGMWAAGLLGFYLIFYLPSAVIPVTSDLLMLAPNAAAVWMASKRRPFWSGALAAVAFWINPKGVFVAAVCLLWYPAGALPMAAGWATVSATAAAILWSCGAQGPYWREVWTWGRIYAGDTFLAQPVRNGILRTLNWAGFHGAAVAAAAWLTARTLRAKTWTPHLRWVLWGGISLAGVAAGWRFFPRYYFLLLPVVVLMAARGFALLGRLRGLVALLLLIPLVRFGPTYAKALMDAGWQDVAMDRDSRAAAALIREASRPGDTLFVWGYRPEMYAYTRLPAATMFLDSQPLTGVPADRHLSRSAPVETVEARRHRAALAASQPTFIADGLSAYNPRLAIAQYPDLSLWLTQYREVARTPQTVIYQRLAR